MGLRLLPPNQETKLNETVRLEGPVFSFVPFGAFCSIPRRPLVRPRFRRTVCLLRVLTVFPTADLSPSVALLSRSLMPPSDFSRP